MRQQIDALKIKGSVLVIKDNKTLLDYATNNATDTSYLINSVQKSMTAALVMRLVQTGKLSLQDPLSKFYPAIPGSKKIKLANLISMTAGLSLRPGSQLGSRTFKSDQANLEHNIAKTIFVPKMLGKWYYSSLNYIYLCGILSQVTGKSYEKLFRDTYIKPLKLKHTEFLWAKSAQLLNTGFIPGKVYKKGRYFLVKAKTALSDAHNELGAGSIVMSNHDLAKVIHYLLAGKFLSSKSRKLLYQAGSPSFYNGGFYNNSKFKIANGAGEGYYTFLRSTKDGKTMLIIQSDRTRMGQFASLKPQIDKIMKSLID